MKDIKLGDVWRTEKGHKVVVVGQVPGGWRVRSASGANWHVNSAGVSTSVYMPSLKRKLSTVPAITVKTLDYPVVGDGKGGLRIGCQHVSPRDTKLLLKWLKRAVLK